MIDHCQDGARKDSIRSEKNPLRRVFCVRAIASLNGSARPRLAGLCRPFVSMVKRVHTMNQLACEATPRWPLMQTLTLLSADADLQHRTVAVKPRSLLHAAAALLFRRSEAS